MSRVSQDTKVQGSSVHRHRGTFRTSFRRTSKTKGVENLVENWNMT